MYRTVTLSCDQQNSLKNKHWSLPFGLKTALKIPEFPQQSVKVIREEITSTR